MKNHKIEIERIYKMSTFQKNRKIKSKSGFTLIELLVVVAIISVLIAILLPALNSAREQARMAGCASQLHQMGMAFAYYRGECNDFFPMIYNDAPINSNNISKISKWPYHAWNYVFVEQMKYLPSYQVFACASFPADGGLWYGWTLFDHGERIRMHYGYNHTHLGQSRYYGTTSGYGPPARENQIQDMSRTILVTDSLRYLEGYYCGSSFNEGSLIGYPHARHKSTGNVGQGTVNVLWCDGHVGGISLSRDISEPVSYYSVFGNAYDLTTRNFGFWGR
jgi:prepilin-type N-terminal cleavage/methylation domain-containing protein/prepilin-type processing-associated H-X9-DG protein